MTRLGPPAAWSTRYPPNSRRGRSVRWFPCRGGLRVLMWHVQRALRLRWMFVLSCVASCGLFLGYFRYSNPTPPEPASMGDGIFVTSQVTTRQVARVRSGISGTFRTIIDLRPDGEAADQASSADMAAEAHRWGMEFAYIPVPHGEVPAATVSGLAAALQTSPKPVLLYCRSGNRAVRACALVLASTMQGPNEGEIMAMARAAGHPVDDLGAAIHARVAARAATGVVPK